MGTTTIELSIFESVRDNKKRILKLGRNDVKFLILGNLYLLVPSGIFFDPFSRVEKEVPVSIQYIRAYLANDNDIEKILQWNTLQSVTIPISEDGSFQKSLEDLLSSPVNKNKFLEMLWMKYDYSVENRRKYDDLTATIGLIAKYQGTTDTLNPIKEIAKYLSIFERIGYEFGQEIICDYIRTDISSNLQNVGQLDMEGLNMYRARYGIVSSEDDLNEDEFRELYDKHGWILNAPKSKARVEYHPDTMNSE
jgi:hypothetical protein